ncbi:Cytochrome oxidase biogenesis protein Surf1, facilitates heme A insertion [Microbacterium esteraromaticum]|uniref:SURF1-like protein n=1 Tax=Microbacterium esteraromaticum TaxID=57043 RepID=A0A1R4J5V5_9MICO|nr:SURF1 family cytochrome oxidase biogenesis protein [Microbacterium esteraromaticum]SJN27480.1 Cytochrome oxidase biogenesis protein Surf1, facilitates heme A insertion [Microbacterium esteraromaticum]
MTSTEPALPQEFPPTLREVLLRRRWLGVLVLCLVVAGVFAWLGQWQLGRAIDTDPPPPGATEQVRPLTDVIEPGKYLAESAGGQRVETSGTWLPEDFIVISSRFNDGAEGYWVTGQLRVAERTSIAVALGWAQTREEADAAASALADAGPVETTITGRVIDDEGVEVPPRTDPLQLTRMSPAALLSRWHDVEQLNVYRPYLASVEAPAGLVDISSPAPTQKSPVNWLNVFYAAEWAVFAGFAFYLWYRLAKDAWEREVEEFEDAAGPEPTA